MTYNEAIELIHSVGRFKKTTGLSRIQNLLEALGNSQEQLRCIHVAGTNGKGSVCAMLESVLRHAGYRTGLFTSPFIRNFEERIRVDGECIGEDDLAQITSEVRAAAEGLEDMPCEFELITAIGFLYFFRQKVDVVILEVGLGGRFDATNVIKTPVLSVITGIDFDHTELLGNSIQAIAAEKAGIVKEGCPCLYGGSDSSACRTIGTIAKLRHAPFHTVDRTEFCVRSQTLDGTVFDFDDYKDLKIPLLGSFQPYNASIVMTALALIAEQGYPVKEEQIKAGLEHVTWQARFELLSREPAVIFDGGHNPQGVGAAIEGMHLYFPEQKVNLITGVMSDKGYDEMIERLKPITEHAFTVCTGGVRSLSAQGYAESFRLHKVGATAYETVEDGVRAAIEKAKENGCPVLCLGSLYLYRDVADAVKKVLGEQ